MVSLETNIIILVVLIALSGFFSSAELAIFSISKVKMRKIVSSGKRNALLLQDLKSKPQTLLNTILIGNNLVNVSAASLATAVALETFPSDYGIAIATAIITLAILIFGEITPKSLALKHNEVIALSVSPVLKLLSTIFMPFIIVLNKITGFFTKIIGGEKSPDALTEEEVKTVVSLGAEEGAIQKEEKEMIHRIFRLNDITVEDVMTSRSEIVSVESGIKISSIDKKLLREHSRLPVYKDDLDEVLGIFHVRDFISYTKKDQSTITVDKLMRPVPYVFANKKIDKLMKEFQKSKTHMAIVVDEYGGTIGLVTIEDILEEIVGEIIDETDVEPKIKKINPNEFVVEGQVPLELLNKAIKVTFKCEEFDTAAGLVIETMDKVPKEKDEIIINSVKFVVEKMDGPRIEILRIFK
ncbi:MAG: hemolysin family protein [archaeon]|nr:hemolysin family protein [archaeon]